MSELVIDLEESKTTNEQPKSGYFPKWKVIFHNDNHTPMRFVITVLNRFFNKNLAEAEKLMLEIHTKGHGVAGIYPKEQAELRTHETIKLARLNGYPLQLTIEKE